MISANKLSRYGLYVFEKETNEMQVLMIDAFVNKGLCSLQFFRFTYTVKMQNFCHELKEKGLRGKHMVNLNF